MVYLLTIGAGVLLGFAVPRVRSARLGLFVIGLALLLTGAVLAFLDSHIGAEIINLFLLKGAIADQSVGRFPFGGYACIIGGVIATVRCRAAATKGTTPT